MTYKVTCEQCSRGNNPIVWNYDKFREASEQVTFHHNETGHERLRLEMVE